MFYHVLIETAEKVGKTGENRIIYELDKTDKNTIEDEILVPYLQKKSFQFDGYFLQPNEIKRVAIKQTDKISEELVKLEYDNMPSGRFINVTRQNIIEYDKHSIDITKEMFKSAGVKIDSPSPKVTIEDNSLDKSKVFIVHGHDEAAKESVARFIENMGYRPIILHEQASSGKTIIEKIESYTNVGFGIILYTPCDVGGKKVTKPVLKDRARQNVVFEHGYLIAKLGRPKVCALVKGDVETPNDISGVVYIALDEHGAWKMKLANEMKSSGYEIDMNKVF